MPEMRSYGLDLLGIIDDGYHASVYTVDVSYGSRILQAEVVVRTNDDGYPDDVVVNIRDTATKAVLDDNSGLYNAFACYVSTVAKLRDEGWSITRA